MTTQPLTEAERVGVRKLVLHYDHSGNGALDFDEFIHFLKALPNTDLSNFQAKDVTEADINIPIDQVRCFYDGMDVDKSHSVTPNEICDYINAIRTKNFKWQTKMVFRAADKDSSRKVSFDELVQVSKNMEGLDLTKEDFENRCKLELGKEKKELEYWEFYKIITGEELDHDTDPYDGKLPQGSSCCSLI